MRKIIYALAIVVLTVPNIAMAMSKNDGAKIFIDEVVAKVKPIGKDASIAYWMATTTGKKEWYKKYEEKDIEINKIFANKEWFKKARSLQKSNIKDPIVKRQIDLLYLEFLENQIDPKLNEELVRKGSALEKKFNTYRAKMNGKEISDNSIRKILRTSKKQAERKMAWEASKQIGERVAKDLISLVKKRNEAARQLGFKNYYVMQLEFQEQSEKELSDFLNELARLTDKPFKGLKSEIDGSLAKKFGINAADIKPWHYEDVFFQEAPQIYNVDLDKYFKGKDVLKIARDYYAGIGMPVDDILKRSDLFERKGKEQHAYCINIDRMGDIRILANVKHDEYWAATMLHELGHAVYEKYFNDELPYLLKEPAHTFTTEGIAELFGRLTSDEAWLAAEVDPSRKAEIGLIKDDLRRSLRANMLIFVRWVEVMANFEKAMYSDPDQDLDGLWWRLVEKYQLIKKPEGRDNSDWAAKIHFTTSPVYYHNYLMGEVFASQLTHYIDKNIVPKDGAFGEYLKEKVFAPGDSMRWDEFVKFATGEKLTPKYFAKEFIK